MKSMNILIKRSLVAASLVLVSLLNTNIVTAAVLKEDAPTRYTVKKNDTLWDIASLFLDHPWQWPELWRKNTQIDNPHLIYPGDVLVIRMEDGQPTLVVERQKVSRVLSPTSNTIVKPSPIDLLAWKDIAPFMGKFTILDESHFAELPRLLGNETGAVRFAVEDFVLTHAADGSNDQYMVVREAGKIMNPEGEVLGVKVVQVAKAEVVEDQAAGNWVVKIVGSKQEAQRGDKLLRMPSEDTSDMALKAAEYQKGKVVNSLHDHSMLGKYDVVVLDLGSGDVEAGTVMGIYRQGPTIIDGETPRYETEGSATLTPFNQSERIEQPAYKVGEVVVIKTFSKASYGIITQARDFVKVGAIVAAP